MGASLAKVWAGKERVCVEGVVFVIGEAGLIAIVESFNGPGFEEKEDHQRSEFTNVEELKLESLYCASENCLSYRNRTIHDSERSSRMFIRIVKLVDINLNVPSQNELRPSIVQSSRYRKANVKISLPHTVDAGSQ